MKLEEKSVFKSFNFESDHFRITVNASKDPEFGWMAGASFDAMWFKTAEESVKGLKMAVLAFLQQLETLE